VSDELNATVWRTPQINVYRSLVCSLPIYRTIRVRKSNKTLSTRLQLVLNTAARLVFTARNLIIFHCYMISTGCGFRGGSGSCCAFWCIGATHGTARRRHISSTASVEPPMLTVVAVYALSSRTRWSWHRRTVQHLATVLSHQERGMTCLPIFVVC